MFAQKSFVHSEKRSSSYRNTCDCPDNAAYLNTGTMDRDMEEVSKVYNVSYLIDRIISSLVTLANSSFDTISTMRMDDRNVSFVLTHHSELHMN